MPNTPVLNLPYPSATDTADVPRDIQALAVSLDAQQSFLPVGALILWPLAGPPAGNNASGKAAWLICNGQIVSAVDYPKLAALLGAPGGNVTIPDLRDRVPLGASASKPVGSAGGEETHVLLTAEVGTHDHAAGTLSDPTVASGSESADHTHSLSPGEYMPAHANGFYIASVASGGNHAVVAINGLTNLVNALATSGRSAAHTHTTAAHAVTGRTAMSPAAAAHNNLQPYLSLNYVMRAA